MGAGTGKARRTKTAASFCDSDCWQQFLSSQKLISQNLYEYYDLGNANAMKSMGRHYFSEDAIYDVIEHLYYDFVSLGVLTFPSGRSVNNYELECMPSPDGPWKLAVLRYKERPRTTGIVASLDAITIPIETTMGEYKTFDILQRLVEVIYRIG
jgi:hypothetical protein